MIFRSFRLRVLALVSLVAVTAVGATAYLAWHQASRQVNASSVANQPVTEQITANLLRYAREHGTWENVALAVRQLDRSTGQRIKLAADRDGTVLVDTDTLHGFAARPATSGPLLIDPRPTLTLPDSLLVAALPPAVRQPEPTGGGSRAGAAAPWTLTLQEIRHYRSGVRFAACQARRRLISQVSVDRYGVPRYQPDPGVERVEPEAVRYCQRVAAPIDRKEAQEQAVGECRDEIPAVSGGSMAAGAMVVALRRCLTTAFRAQTQDVAPGVMRLFLGAVGTPGGPLTPGPIILAGVLVALLAVAATVLLSRRVLRPIGTLTAASQRLGEGDLSLRVPAGGRDELGMLARSFNRMADSLQRGEEQQRRMVVDVAHELRTPLANLRGYLEALKDGVLPASPELFASLHEEAVLQQRIVDDLQDLALAEAGALAYHRAETDLVELLETCRTAHQAVAEDAGVALELQASGPLPITADPDRLRQVVGNVVTNALRATPAGGSVTLHAFADGGWATLAVRDTGTGIAAADLPYVFDRFWRADTSRDRATGGSGLGLAIARQIVTDHGGHIAAHSEPDQGTAFVIALPLTPVPADRAAAAPAPAREVTPVRS